jgi:DNA-binding NarL/FixJ family response regulator
VISVLIADDHGIVREGVRHIVDSETDIAVCADASSGIEALELIDVHRPDVVLLDINMPEMGGLECLARIRSKYPRMKVILLSVRSDATAVDSAIALRADGFVLKDARIDEIVEAVRDVAKGGVHFSPSVQPRVMTRAREPGGREAEPLAALSAREREVLRLLALGGTSKEIAASLHLSPKTIEAHRASVMKKLDARKATELVRFAIRAGLIEA